MAENLIASLELIKAEASGLTEFNRQKFNQELSYIQELEREKESTEATNRKKLAPYLQLFIYGKYSELETKLQENPSSISFIELKALKILNLLKLGHKISLRDIFPLAQSPELIPQQSIDNLSRHLLFIFFSLYRHLKLKDSLDNIDLCSLEEYLPGISLKYTEYVLRYNIATQYSRAWSILEPYCQESHSNSQAPEAYRLLAIYKRIQGDLIGAETYSLLYHQQKTNHQKLGPKKLITHANIEGYPASEVLSNWVSILEECDEIQTQIFKTAGLEPSTCEYFACSDCCKQTFPTLSYTEYIYLRDWLLAEGYPLDELISRCKTIQADYQNLYGETLQVLDKNLVENNIRGIENPHNYKYSCPFLSEEGRCKCYPARPLLCRGFGLATDNGVSIKTCNYFMTQYQHNNSERDVYDLRPVQSLAKSSDKHITKLKQTGEQCLSGTIVAWFSQE